MGEEPGRSLAAMSARAMKRNSYEMLMTCARCAKRPQAHRILLWR